jgi:hypothetical protein
VGHQLRLGITWAWGDYRFSVLERILAKCKFPLSAFRGGIVDDWQ